MPLLINKNIQMVGEIVEKCGYIKKRVFPTEVEYYKQVKTGRMHMFLQDLNSENTSVSLHFDKYKGESKKERHHTSKYHHPYVKKEEELILKNIK